ncbi:hypothetical protein [Agrobacterium pusense]|uniref:Uncharacterized protein n=1 Tax=Agrobacterium pusense TaxID=648995 RepID=A0AA44EMG4_9HYPH|nr:hypothetical protein [Agrobacterium pusense]NRF10801.1 hypothetical protein [Agrobacterium pusense]NRF21511.1 hypothetical protein [Agrobacterium pusense]
MDLYVMPWKPDDDVYGEAAGLACDDRVLDLVVTHGDGTFYWEVVDGCDSIACGTATSAAEARRAAETAGRRAFIRAA